MNLVSNTIAQPTYKKEDKIHVIYSKKQTHEQKITFLCIYITQRREILLT